jgi:hypothetical protein
MCSFIERALKTGTSGYPANGLADGSRDVVFASGRGSDVQLTGAARPVAIREVYRRSGRLVD